MPNQAFPTVDGDECSWADITVNCKVPGGASFVLVDIEAIKTGNKLEAGESRGASGGRQMKTTAGSESSEASASFTRSGHVHLLTELEKAAMKLPGAVRGNEVIISGVRWEILIQHTPLGSSLIYETKLIGCRYMGGSSDMKQGNEADMIEVTLNPMKVMTKSPTTSNWLVLR